MAAGNTWDTVLTREQKRPGRSLLPLFTAGMPAKLTRVQLRRYAGGKALRGLELQATRVLIPPTGSPGGTGDYNAGASAASENQAYKYVMFVNVRVHIAYESYNKVPEHYYRGRVGPYLVTIQISSSFIFPL